MNRRDFSSVGAEYAAPTGLIIMVGLLATKMSHLPVLGPGFGALAVAF